MPVNKKPRRKIYLWGEQETMGILKPEYVINLIHEAQKGEERCLNLQHHFKYAVRIVISFAERKQ
jgi:hypothetical protein